MATRRGRETPTLPQPIVILAMIDPEDEGVTSQPGSTLSEPSNRPDNRDHSSLTRIWRPVRARRARREEHRRGPTSCGMNPEHVIEVDAIRKAYGPTVAADHVSFTVRRGEIFGLIGPNGAGKTTTMECVEGLRAPDAGRIRVLGLDPIRDRRALQLRFGVQLQEAQLQKRIKVWEAIAFWQSLYPTAVEGDPLLRQLGLHDKRDAWFMTLSGGQKQRLFIALALVNDPEVVFLDELTTGLDPQARRAIWELVRGIRERGKTVFLTTHLMEEAERLCDRVAILDHGRIVDIDRPTALVARHCPQRTVVVATDFPDAADRFRSVPSVTGIRHEDGRYTIDGRGDGLVTDVIHAISEHRMRVAEFRTVLPTLEDVFLTLTGRSIRA